MGIRFGLAPGAWRYALLACGQWILKIATLGLWHPRLRWALARFRHDRMYFGTEKFEQGGGPGLLYPAFVHVAIGGGITLGALLEAGPLWAALEGADEGPFLTEVARGSPLFPTLALSLPWLLFGLVYYSVVGRRLLIGALHVGEIALDPRPRVGKVLWILVSGNIARYLLTFLLVTLGIVALVTAAFGVGVPFAGMDGDDPFEILQLATTALPEWVPFVLLAIFYFLVFLIWNACTHIFLRLPTWRHYAATLRLRATKTLSGLTQRDRDASPEARRCPQALAAGAAK